MINARPAGGGAAVAHTSLNRKQPQKYFLFVCRRVWIVLVPSHFDFSTSGFLKTHKSSSRNGKKRNEYINKW